MIETVLRHCIVWEQRASSLLQDTVCLINEDALSDGNFNTLIPKIESHVPLLKSTIEAGLSLKFEFQVISKLQDAHCTLQWCFKALSFFDIIPTLEVSVISFSIVISLSEPSMDIFYWLNTILVFGVVGN